MNCLEEGEWDMRKGEIEAKSSNEAELAIHAPKDRAGQTELNTRRETWER